MNTLISAVAIKRPVLSLGVALGMLGASLAHGTYLTNDTFTGTSLDLSKWEVFTSGTATVTQNNRIILTGTGGNVDYTTQALTIGSDPFAVRVQFTPISHNGFGNIGLFLTDDFNGTAQRLLNDHYQLGLGYQMSSSQVVASKNDSGGSGSFFLTSTPIYGALTLGTTYGAEIVRSGLTGATIRLWDGNYTTLLGSHTYTGLNPLPSQMFISFQGNSAVSEWDNLELQFVPEPSMVGLLLVGSMLVRRGRFRHPKA